MVVRPVIRRGVLSDDRAIGSICDFRQLDLKVSLIVGVSYKQKEKEEREQKAIRSIKEKWYAVYPPGSIGREQVNLVLKRMGFDKF